MRWHGKVVMIDRYPSALAALPEELVALLRDRGTPVRARAGRTLIALGEGGNQVYLVLDGRVQTSLVSLNGRDVILRDLGPGDLFGELAAIDEQPRSASVVALTDCVLACLSGNEFRAAVTDLPPVAHWIARRLTRQVRDLTERVFELNALRVRSRLHCELLRMCAGADEAVTVEPAPTHLELASRIGTHREAVTREMRYLMEEGIIQQQRRRLTVLDVPALARLVRTATGSRDQDLLFRAG